MHDHKITRKILRRTVVSATIGLSLAVLFREFVLEGIFVPVRVVGGSMAPALLGQHYRMTCRDCGWAFPCGADFSPSSGQTVCPNCGSRDIESRTRETRGQRVFVNKWSLRFRDPRRWEMVAARDPDDSSRWVVKRAIGLPGETVEIRDGDVFIDGQVARKPLSYRRTMAAVVHDDRFRRDKQGQGEWAGRWTPAAEQTAWMATATGYRFDGKNNRVTAADEVDWLNYRHVASCLPRPEQEMPFTDHNGYNQSLTRELNQVSDVYITGTCTLSGEGVFVVRYFDGHQTWTTQVSPKERKVELLCDEIPIADAAADTTWDRRQFSFGVCDQSVFFQIEDRAVVRHLFRATGPARQRAFPLAMGAKNLTAEIDDVVIWRDVFYTHPVRSGAPWRRSLGRDEFLLLGDNSPVSEDGRHWKHATNRNDLIGPVIACAETP